MASRLTSLLARPSATRFVSTTSGTPSKTMSAVLSAVAASVSAITATRPVIASTALSSNMPSCARVRSVSRTSFKASSRSLAKSAAGRALKSITSTRCPA